MADERNFPNIELLNPHNPETAFAWGPKGIDEKNRYASLTVNMQDIERTFGSGKGGGGGSDARNPGCCSPNRLAAVHLAASVVWLN